MVKDREYKEWLRECSNEKDKDFDGFIKYSLTWPQIRIIALEERRRMAKEIREIIILKGYDVAGTHTEEEFNKIIEVLDQLTEKIKRFV